MKNLLLKLLLLFLFVGFGLENAAQAITWEIIGPCSPTPLYQGQMEVSDLQQSVGKVTLDLLTKGNIPFVGNEAGINTIAGSPTGDAALEIINDRQMRAYGLCFSVNGVLPEVYMDKYYFLNSTDHLRWFYGYSDYEAGVWINYCQPAHELQSKFICP